MQIELGVRIVDALVSVAFREVAQGRSRNGRVRCARNGDRKVEVIILAFGGHAAEHESNFVVTGFEYLFNLDGNDAVAKSIHVFGFCPRTCSID